MDTKARATIVKTVVGGVLSKLLLDVLESPNLHWLAKAVLVGVLLALLSWIVIRTLNVSGRKEADAQAPRTTETNLSVRVILSQLGREESSAVSRDDWNASRLSARHSPPARPASPPIYSSAPRIVKK